MDQLVYVYYLILFGILLWGAKLCKKKTWNDGFLSLSQTKAMQGFLAIGIMLHHAAQKTCAPWLNARYIVHGLDFFLPFGYFFVGFFLFCSGYGLYKSYREKKNYLDGFLKRRVLPLVLAFYSTALIFLVVRLIMGEKPEVPQLIYYISGLQLSNPNAWYVITLPIFYLAFYFAFRFCKKDGVALILVCAFVFLYTMLGTFIDHNNWWMRGEWWYNSVHLFSIGLIFARYETAITKHLKKYYPIYLLASLVAVFGFFELAEYATARFSYYGETFHAEDKVLRRWICLLAQMAASGSFVFSVILLGLKIKIGNRVLKFMGTLTLEFYLIHGLFLELFGYSFLDISHSVYYIKNVALFVFVVLALSVPSAWLLQKFHHRVLRLRPKKEIEEHNGSK